MKKLIALTFALVVTFSFIGCKGSDNSANNSGSPTAAESSSLANAPAEDNNYNLNETDGQENLVNEAI